MSLASRLSVVLVRPQVSANVGAVARVCANFEVARLDAVNPACSWAERESPEAPSVDARKIAVGAAAQVLDAIRTHATVREAVADCQLAVGFTRRSGEHRTQTLELAELAPLIHQAQARSVALVFGNEETGLTDEELVPCSHFCRIPTGETLPSLNLSHAVVVVVARVFDDLSRLQTAPKKLESGRVTQPPPAPLSEMHGFMDHWRELLVESGLTGAGNPERLLRRLERLFFRLQPSLREVRLLRGILSKAQYWIRKGRSS